MMKKKWIYKCPKCGEKFRYLNSYKQHMKKEEKNG